MKYVYTHSIDDVVFYVGCGGKYRPQSKTRSDLWHDFVNKNGGAYDINIVAKYSNSELAKKRESRLIREYMPECNILGKYPLPKSGRGFTLTFDAYIKEKIRLIVGNDCLFDWCEDILKAAPKGKQNSAFNYKTGEIFGSINFTIDYAVYDKIKQSAKDSGIGMRKWCRNAVLNEMTKYYGHDLKQ